MVNKQLGNALERKVCNFLYCMGYWSHNFVQGPAGQPADIIAVRNYHAYLIDAKVCSNSTFPLTRREANQITAMDLWEKCGNGSGWFACELPDGEVYMLSATRIKRYFDEGKKTLNEKDIREGVRIRKWAESCGQSFQR